MKAAPRSLSDRIPLLPGTLLPVAGATVALACAEFVRNGVYTAYLPLVGPSEFGLPLTATSAALTAHFIADTLMRGPAGVAISRYGLRPVVAGGALLGLVALALLPFAHTFWLLILIAAVHGVGFSVLWPGALNLTADSSKPGYSGRAISIVTMCALPMIGVGVLVYGAIGRHGGNFPLTLAIALQGLAVLAALLMPMRRVRQRNTAPAPTRESTRRVFRSLVPLMPAAFLQTGTLSLIGPLLFPIAKKMGIEYWPLVSILVLGGVLAYATIPFAGRIADRGRARPVLSVGFALIGVAFALLATTPPVWAIYPIAALLGLGYGCVTPGWSALVTSTLPEAERPAAWGALMTVENTGTALSPVIGAFAYQTIGVSGPFLVGAVLALTTASAYAMFRRAFPAPVQT
ncbi:MFS transporter [Deinococcus sp. Arct2-2]|uniref:MFS transporter n=1 Tax=Deinococcus sp. Arct2-2 TaxID=2568653 RepID=UPI0010A3AE08|nr:MFS transporter [Deinococcus sp. Arct2-2]THF69489.1 MFS transporter [Deinococcus sp. Arct2-2]